MDKFDYWVRIKEMDGSWTEWRNVSRDRYLRTANAWDIQTKRTDKNTGEIT